MAVSSFRAIDHLQIEMKVQRNELQHHVDAVDLWRCRKCQVMNQVTDWTKARSRSTSLF